MKKFISLLVLLISATAAFSQKVFVKHPDFSSFNKDKKQVSEILLKNSSPKALQHPEFGVLPYNAQCSECVELIDKRTMDSRLFLDSKNPGYIYSQKSHFPLHYKTSENDVWRTIDQRLRPDARHPGVYTAANQPVATKCDLNTKSTTLITDGFNFEFNRNLKLFFFDENVVDTKVVDADYTNYTIGEEGLEVKNIWNGINMQQIFRAGEIETNYTITSPLQLPISKGWMVIEDHFTLPKGLKIEESPDGWHSENGYYHGNYLLKNTTGETLITYAKPVYFDTRVFGMHGIYKLTNTGNDYTLQTLIPVEWLNNPDNIYPLTIDPIVYGTTKIGNYESSGGAGAGIGFSSNPDSCINSMHVIVPGPCKLLRAYIDFEYTLTYDNTCGHPPESAPYCTFSQVTIKVLSDSCHVSTGNLTCSPASPPYTGTCSTDSDLVPSAHSFETDSNFVACFPSPDCSSNVVIPFTLITQDSICGDECGYLCARLNMWQMTVYAYSYSYASYNGSWFQDTLLAAGTYGFTANTGGIAYLWHFGDGDSSTLQNPVHTYQHSGTYAVLLNVTDSIGCTEVSTDTLTVVVSSVPPIETGGIKIYPLPAGNDLNIASSQRNLEEITVKDMQGNSVLDVKNVNNKVKTLHISLLATGVYIIEVKAGGETFSSRFVKHL